MRFTKHARTKIRQAKGPVEIQWPLRGGIPVEGNKYRAGNSFSIIVIARRKCPKRWKAVVTEDHDPIRSLRIKARQPQDPETGRKTETEPEPVDKATQDRFSVEGAVKTALSGSEQRMRGKASTKREDTGTASTPRSEKTKARHLKSIEGNLSQDA